MNIQILSIKQQQITNFSVILSKQRMGNECDQCEAVTQGCKRQQFREQLKNRQKLDLSRAHGHQKSRKQLNAIAGLRNVPLIEAAKYQQQNEQQDEQQKQIKQIKPPDLKQIKPPDLKQKSLEINRETQPIQKQNPVKLKPFNTQIDASKKSVDQFKYITLPIDSVIANKNKLQQLQKQLNFSIKQSPVQHLDKNNLSRMSQDSALRMIEQKQSFQKSYQQKQNKQNIQSKIFKKKQTKFIVNYEDENHEVRNQELKIKRTNSFTKQKKVSVDQYNYEKELIQNNPSKVLKQFNRQLKENSSKLQSNQQKYINHDHFNESQTDKIEIVKEHHFYLKPGIYFEGFISTIDHKINKKCTIKFQTDGTQVEANFKKGNLNTEKNVIVSFNDQSYFEGLVDAGSFTTKGFGKFVDSDGSYYAGEWLKNLPHGKGKHKFSDGSEYQGQFIQGKKQGIGKFVTSQKQLIYEGSFLNNRIQGKGVMHIIQPNTNKKRIYKGYFKNGKLQGQQCQVLYVEQQAKYVGSFHDGKKHGKGKYFYDDGRTWEGEWKNNRQNGFGRYKNLKGTVVEGYWIDGVKSEDKLYIN